VACGAASGVAAAFGAPIGGVLFSLEEGASFWSTNLTWRCFFCAMTTVFFLFVVNTAKHSFGHSDSTAMFSFGEFFSLQGEQSNYAVWELFSFLLMGCLGGLLGAIFNSFTEILFRWRSKYILHRPAARYAEILAISAMMSGLSLFISWSWSKCTPLPVDMEGWSDQERTLVTQLVPLYCDDETEYNEVASLFLTDSDNAIRQLFHFREIGDHTNDYTFSTPALLLFFIQYFVMACVTYGTAVPAGMFVPSLLSGAAFGRLIGHLLHKLDAAHGTFADSGTYALMGAAAITSGIARMTISLTVMVLEATGDMQYVLPLMLTVLTARFIGNIFTEGIYDMHIHSRNLHFLDEDESIGRLIELHDLTVADVMTVQPMCFRPVMLVGDCFDLLKTNEHHCFPVGRWFLAVVTSFV
jgi:chloride channel 7